MLNSPSVGGRSFQSGYQLRCRVPGKVRPDPRFETSPQRPELNETQAAECRYAFRLMCPVRESNQRSKSPQILRAADKEMIYFNPIFWAELRFWDLTNSMRFCFFQVDCQSGTCPPRLLSRTHRPIAIHGNVFQRTAGRKSTVPQNPDPTDADTSHHKMARVFLASCCLWFSAQPFHQAALTARVTHTQTVMDTAKAGLTRQEAKHF